MTAGELRERITNAELEMWLSYVEEYGPLNLALRFDSAVARAMSSMSKEAKPRDFMPWPREPEPEATLEGLFGIFKKAATTPKARKR